MNIKSIRFRLTILYSLAFFIGTVVMFVIFYIVTKQTLLLQTDQELTVHAEALANIIVNGQSNMMTGVFNQGVITQQFSEMPGMLVAVSDGSGKISTSSQQGAQSDPIIKDLLQKSSMIVKPVFVDRTIGSTILRIGVFPVSVNGSTTGLVLMGDPIEAIYHSLNSLLVSLFIINLLFFIPALIGGHILARKAMEPVSAISKKLAKITSDNLNERVGVLKTSDELEELAMTFNSLLDRIAQAFQRERQFIGDVAHELKTPVATLRGGIELALSKKRTNGEYTQTLSGTLIDVNRLSNTIRNILDLAWLGAENANLGEHHFDISTTVTELRDIGEKLAAQKHIAIQGDVEPNIQVVGVEDKIYRAILNVIDNAIKYTPQDKTVSISLFKKRKMAIVRVKDTGSGISEKDLGHIFDRFYRGSKTAKTVGSGLGLAIAQGIIQAHGGDINISSTLGKGTSVVISLPLYLAV
ncbi:HAMP domain-containing protein [Candidatus Gottesmanbacteria bacterium]|nr:HAMP domain-containing protein [Candidatus Gottesmanbacteria bacterium]